MTNNDITMIAISATALLDVARMIIKAVDPTGQDEDWRAGAEELELACLELVAMIEGA